MNGARRKRSFGGYEAIPAPIAEIYAYGLMLAVNALLDILESMTHKYTWEELSQAQTERTLTRQQWGDLLLDCLFDLVENGVTEERKAHWRERMAELNRLYTDVLNATDLALVNRISSIIGNEQLARMEADDQLGQRLKELEIGSG